MSRLSLLLLLLLLAAACGGRPAPAPTPPPAPLAAACGEATLRAFSPGPGPVAVELIELAPVDLPRSASRELVEPCAAAESDDACGARARAAALASPGAEVHDISITGEPDGYDATLEVDGVPRQLHRATDDEVIAEARRLQAAGHEVVPVEMHRVYRADSRHAVVRWSPAPAGPAPRIWQGRLRWQPAGPLPEALHRLQQAADADGLVVLRFDTLAGGTVLLTLACP